MNFKYAKKYVMMGFIVCMLILLSSCGGEGCSSTQDTNGHYLPLIGYERFWDFLTYPITGMFWLLGELFGGWYFLVIIVGTLIIRTIAWPIYAKSNDMSLKMQLAGPELQKIEKRYEGRTDRESMTRKQAEVSQLYKKYKIGLGGCITPFIQMPIFIAVFETLRRIPSSRFAYAEEYIKTFDSTDPHYEFYNNIVNATEKISIDFGHFNDEFLGMHLFEKIGTFKENKAQFIGVIVIAILVGATQIISQLISSKRQKQQQEKQFEHIPEYRRPQKTESQNQTEMMLKIMLYVMPLMMVYFIISSPAALGLYWLVGNVYTFLQNYLGSKSSKKRLEKLREKIER